MEESYYREVFSRNLRRYMALNNKSQVDLINDLGFNRSSVSTWVNGTRLPRMDKVDMLAQYFNIKRSDLIETDNQPLELLIETKTRESQALELYEKYMNAIPEIKAAVDGLLKGQQSEDK